jgi:hypothetical protein
MKTCKLLLATSTVAVLLGALVASASARNLFVSDQTFTATFASMEFRTQFTLSRCPLTLEGSFHSRSMAKVREALIGYIARAELGTCTGNPVTLLTETLPWHIRYSSFEGGLPNIGLLRSSLIGFAAQIREVQGLPCLIRSTPEEPYSAGFVRSITERTLTQLQIGGSLRVNNLECWEVGKTIPSLGNSNSLVVTGSSRRATMELI